MPWCAREEARGEVPLPLYGRPSRVGKNNEGRQVIGEAPQAVAEPGTHAGKTGQKKASVDHVAAGAVDVRL